MRGCSQKHAEGKMRLDVPTEHEDEHEFKERDPHFKVRRHALEPLRPQQQTHTQDNV